MKIKSHILEIAPLHFGGALVSQEEKKTAQRYAIFAEASYYANPEDKRKILDKFGKQAWDVVPMTTNDATTFKNRDTGEVVVGIRGTDVKNIEDLFTDLALVGGVSRFTPRASQITKIVQYAINTYGKDKVSVSGHSLGGELARQMANKFGIKGYIYNRASSLLDVFNKKNPDIKDFSTNIGKTRDVVSMLGTTQKKHSQAEFEKLSGKDAHTLQNFLPQSQEEIEQTGKGLRKGLRKFVPRRVKINI